MKPATEQQIQEWRNKAMAGTLTREELREAISILREDRLAMGSASAKSKAKKGPVDSQSLLDELEGL